jgi:cardiolipin synthase C
MRCLPLLGLGLFLALGACVSPEVDHAAINAAVIELQGRSFATGDVDGDRLESEYLDRAHDRLAGRLIGERAHEVAILETGQDALVARLHLIRSARESIDFQTFSWGDDDSSRLIYWEFVAAARRGVHVRLLVDQLGLGGSPDTLAFTTFVDPDLELRLYNVLSRRGRNTTENLFRNALGNFQHMNHRMHNKLLVVDGCAAIIGGRNIDDRYFDLDPDWLYLDRDVLVSGPVVEDMTRSFQEYWEHELATPAQYLVDVADEILQFRSDVDQVLELEIEHPERVQWALDLAAKSDLYSALVRAKRHDVTLIELAVDPPAKDLGDDRGSGRDPDTLMGHALQLTDESLLLQSNYLVLTSSTRRGLAEMRRERPDFELAFSTNSLAATGAPYVYAISRKQRRNLVRLCGMEMYELKPRPLRIEELVPRIAEIRAERPDGAGPTLAIHAKSFVVNDEIALIGSHNFDPRSVHYNTEGGVLIHDRGLAAELEASMRLVMAPHNSWAVARKPRVVVWREFNSFMQGFSRGLPVLDIWPWRYTTAYDLRAGADPVRMGDEEFYASYEDVGELPETTRNKRVVTRLTSAFGGFAEPLM